MRDVRTLPKAHLHLHLEGSMRPSTLRELCTRDDRPVPEITGFGDFGEFAGTYLAACEVLRTADDLRRLVFEVVEDAALDGCVWVEPAFYPQHHSPRLGSPRELWEQVFAFGREAADAYGISVGWMAALDRTLDLSVAATVTDLVLDLVADGAPIVSFGLHNDEAGHPPEPFAAQFRRAADAGLAITPHAGELDGPASVRGALDALGADRILHGVRAIEDPQLVERLADEGTVLDVCPTSNVLLSVVPSIVEHPLPALLAAGVRCTINADDPLLFGPGIADEYALARSQLGLSDDQLAAIARTSIEASAAPGETKRAALERITAWSTRRTEVVRP